MNEPQGRGPGSEELGWGIASMVINVLVIVGIGILVPVFRHMADVYQISRNYRLVFYVVAALAVANAIRRIVMQWIRLRRPAPDPDEDGS